MAKITAKTNNRYKVTLTKEELNTVTIALALLNIPQMEDEMKEQGLGEKDVVFNHLKLFAPFAKETGLYPQQLRTAKGKGEAQ
jgi:hypothetical protein